MWKTCLTLGALLLSASLAEASIQINIQNATFTAGGSGSVDVTLTTDSNVDLAVMNLEFLITPISATGNLEFAGTQSESQLGNGAYVFVGQSFDADFASPVGAVSTTTTTNDTYIGGDSSDPLANVNLAGSIGLPVTTLLFTLDLNALNAVAGDSFSIGVVPGGFSSLTDMDSNDISFSAYAGTVDIASSVVPEPASMILWGLSAMGLIAYRRRSVGQKA